MNRPTGHVRSHTLVFVRYFLLAMAGIFVLWLLWYFVLKRAMCKCCKSKRYSELELEEIRTRHRLEVKRLELNRMRDITRVRERKRLYEENRTILGQAKDELGRFLLGRRAVMKQEIVPTPRDEEGMDIYGDAWLQGVRGINGGAPIREVMGGGPENYSDETKIQMV